MSMLALDKVALFVKTVRANGGIIGLLSKLWRMDTVKEGRCVGCDEHGNRYFENDRYMIPRNRWVEYNPKFKFEYDASQITPEWFGWIHHKTDRLPCQDCAKLQLACNCCVRCWLMPPEENRTATVEAYYPYSTINNYIEVWDGCSVCNRKEARPCPPPAPPICPPSVASSCPPPAPPSCPPPAPPSCPPPVASSCPPPAPPCCPPPAPPSCPPPVASSCPPPAPPCCPPPAPPCCPPPAPPSCPPPATSSCPSPVPSDCPPAAPSKGTPAAGSKKKD